MQRSVETMSGNTAPAKPKITGRGRKLLYFSYGAEMLSSRIQSRCNSPKAIATARLADHRLVFHGYSPVWDGGLETVDPAPGCEVWGVVYELSFSDADSLDTWQGVRLNGTGAYFHSPAEVTDGQGTVYAVLVYKKDVLGEPTAPSQPYLDAIVAGARQQALPPQAIETLQAIPAKPAAYPVPKFGLTRQPGVLPGESCADCGSLVPSRIASPKHA
ncbi:gamma-glutamylcyclotransferase family protein [Desulfovibrio sp. TomC]|uniref:gamma-glutamylcyclotransferase family protein n=1 Tax=Desulfovibrio sp. TomC TaxID=1562888 RepID=UPI000573B8D7|nr:gamma-glutamylcyclotransferase family protein [Desulfovibrio sp. TomC]KHK02880.1 AnfR protein, required for Mo- and V-independent nitrogenase [Desulfovibrio sp. TomC]